MFSWKGSELTFIILFLLATERVFQCWPSPPAVAIEMAMDWAMQVTIAPILRTSSTVNLWKIQSLVESRIKTLRIETTSINQVKTLTAGVQVSRSSCFISPTCDRGAKRSSDWKAYGGNAHGAFRTSHGPRWPRA